MTKESTVCCEDSIIIDKLDRRGTDQPLKKECTIMGGPGSLLSGEY